MLDFPLGIAPHRDITTRPSPAVQAIINDYFQRLAEVMPKGAVTPVAGLQDAEVFHEQMVGDSPFPPSSPSQN